MTMANRNGETSVKSAYHCATLLDNWDEERRQFGQPVVATGGDDKTALGTTYLSTYKKPTAQQTATAKPPGCFAAEGPRMLLFHHGDIGNIQQYGYATSELALTDRHKDIYTNEEVLDMPGVSGRRHRSTALQRSTSGLRTSQRGTAGGSGKGAPGEEEVSPAVQREANVLQTMASTVRSGASASTTGGMSVIEEETTNEDNKKDGGDYVPPRFLPTGRAAERERLLTTKNVTIDATGAYLYDNLESYPLTSSKSVGAFVQSCNNPMHKTNLRVHYMEDDY